jgi:hypothetical protein
MSWLFPTAGELNNQGLLALGLGNAREARILFEKAVAKAPTDAVLWWNLGRAHLHPGAALSESEAFFSNPRTLTIDAAKATAALTRHIELAGAFSDDARRIITEINRPPSMMSRIDWSLIARLAHLALEVYGTVL